MTPIEWLMLGHLAGVVCCSTPLDEAGKRVTYPTQEACEQAGREWLRRLRVRSPLDYFECFERRDGAREASVSETERRTR